LKDDSGSSSIIKEIELHKPAGAYFGFYIKGGKHRPLGITVTDVEKDSAAGFF
jgi:hypothetical protein